VLSRYARNTSVRLIVSARESGTPNAWRTSRAIFRGFWPVIKPVNSESRGAGHF
jgi:hypothetical protein